HLVKVPARLGHLLVGPGHHVVELQLLRPGLHAAGQGQQADQDRHQGPSRQSPHDSSPRKCRTHSATYSKPALTVSLHNVTMHQPPMPIEASHSATMAMMTTMSMKSRSSMICPSTRLRTMAVTIMAPPMFMGNRAMIEAAMPQRRDSMFCILMAPWATRPA